ncbi:TetR/AcrR family transcriptional regulator [Xanthobacter autotrophicus]|uniref:TetR/AcrR family transcriptional regulator n=1 Tax=Xanthobacter TaxID=279 RepID=UPI0024AA9FA4|nr:TetR/AcrR family transcriptional regulator [Xanthobacter autotrophicus]MDI4663571.1 TetR/AcrR family transcriptional regulator [Xanthobacter autotrophicus]
MAPSKQTGTAQAEPSPWRSPAQRGHDRALKREAVLKAAARLFNEKGFHATSLDDVARQLNVTKPTLYHYFRSKDDVLFECCRMGLEMIEAAAAPVPGSRASGLERLRALMEKYAEAMTMDFGMSITRTPDTALSPENRAELRRLKSQIDQALRGVIASGIDDGSIAPCDVRTAAFTIAGALNAIAHWYKPGGPLSPAEIAHQTADFLIQGLAPRTPERRQPKR